MFIKILYDNQARRGMRSGWGFSCIVDGRVLFDTGEAADSLVDNMGRLVVDLDRLEAVVISHDHWDHTGGLWEVLKRKSGLRVYSCPGFSSTFKSCSREAGADIRESRRLTQVAEDIYTTGAIKTNYKGEVLDEQALIVDGELGVSLITGCAHPGIDNMVRKTKRKMKTKELYMALGGFHLNKASREDIESVIKELEKQKVRKVGPAHCTGEKAIRMFAGRYHDRCIPVQAGQIIQL